MTIWLLSNYVHTRLKQNYMSMIPSAQWEKENKLPRKRLGVTRRIFLPISSRLIHIKFFLCLGNGKYCPIVALLWHDALLATECSKILGGIKKLLLLQPPVDFNFRNKCVSRRIDDVFYGDTWLTLKKLQRNVRKSNFFKKRVTQPR